MSIYATKWAYAQPVQPAGRKFILVAVADFADAEGRAFPGVDTLAVMTGQDERSVRRHLEALEAEGYLKRVERRRRNGSRTTDELWLQAPETALRPEPPATGQSARLPRTAGQSARLSGSATGQSVHSNRTICPTLPDKLSAPPEPSVNHHYEPPKESAANLEDLAKPFGALSQEIEKPQRLEPPAITGPAESPANAEPGPVPRPGQVPGAAAGDVQDTETLLHRVFGARMLSELIASPASLADRTRWTGVPLERAQELLGQARTEASRLGFKVPTMLRDLLDREVRASSTVISTPSHAAPTPFQVGQEVLYMREHYTVEAVTDSFLDLYDDRNGSVRLSRNSSDFASVKQVGA